MAGLQGDVGINGVLTQVDLDPGDIIRHIDMAASLRAELSKRRFRATADVVYLTLSDGAGTRKAIEKADLQVDELLADVGLHRRVVEGA